jgi:hypothetical protein
MHLNSLHRGQFFRNCSGGQENLFVLSRIYRYPIHFIVNHEPLVPVNLLKARNHWYFV